MQPQLRATPNGRMRQTKSDATCLTAAYHWWVTLIGEGGGCGEYISTNYVAINSVPIRFHHVYFLGTDTVLSVASYVWLKLQLQLSILDGIR